MPDCMEGASRLWLWPLPDVRDEPSGNISIRVESAHVRLLYTWTPYGHAAIQFDYRVWIERTPCYYGGCRVWFRCPRCEHRCAVLYGLASDGRFGCRQCMRLGDASEAESRIDRMNRKSHELEAMLTEDGQKPKWMRWKTFDRICEQLEAADSAWGILVLVRL